MAEESKRLSLIPIAFFACFFLHVWLFVRPHLIYHCYAPPGLLPSFAAGWRFLRDRLTMPGGLAEYVGALLSQTLSVSWAGALSLAAVALALFACTDALLARAGAGRTMRLTAYAPPLVVLAVVNRYGAPLTLSLALATALALALAHGRVTRRGGAAWTVVLFAPTACAAYVVAGGHVLVLLALTAVHQAFTLRRPVRAVLCLVVGVATCWVVARVAFPLAPRDQWLRLLPSHRPTEIATGSVAATVALLVPLVSLLITVAWRSGAREPAAPRRPRLALSTQAWLVSLATIATLALSHHAGRRCVARIAFHAQRGDWPALVQTARGFATKDIAPLCVFDINRALCHTGRLGEEMFAFPQSPEWFLLSDHQDRMSWLMFVRIADLCLDLGYVNLAEKDAAETLENAGPTAWALQTLATASIVKGCDETARVYLNALRRDLVAGRMADDMLERLDADPALATDRGIARIRRHMPASAGELKNLGEQPLHVLLEHDPTNRTAFEYLMAMYSVEGRVHKIVENAGRMRDLGYKHLPIHYEEAIVIHLTDTGDEVDLHGYLLRRDTVEAWRDFRETLKQHGGITKDAWRALAPRFGRSYFFYYTFNASGVWS